MSGKRAQLVCQHLEKVSRTVLEKHQETLRHYVRGRQGVYALYRKGKLYYVGLATNLRQRLKHHLRDRHGDSWDTFSVYLTIGDHHLRELEALMLRVMKPSGNKQKGKFARSDDLRKPFRKMMKESAIQAINGFLGAERQGPRRPPPALSTVRSGRKAVLAAFVKSPLKLKAEFKGRTLHAAVRRDGTIRYAGKIYTSPSLAAAAACQRPSCNGWGFWCYERAPGDWVRLDALRQ